MAYHLDYRPKTFEEFLGNESVVKVLKSLLSKVKHPHSYLFYGEPGCGKTTLARIIGNYLKCNETDILEINISDNRGIDTARSIIEKCHTAPMFGDRMLIILDEVHKSTNDFQNAMLKILEEPPTHVYFVLCTTEPVKVLKTVRSRCSEYEVNRLYPKEIRVLIEKVVSNEKLKLTEDQQNKIEECADGCPRTILMFLEKIKELNDEEIEQSILSFKGEKEEVIMLCRRLMKKDSSWETIAKTIKKIEEEPETVRRAILGYCSAILLKEKNVRAALIIDCFKDNFYDSGKAGLIAACYEVVVG